MTMSCACQTSERGANLVLTIFTAGYKLLLFRLYTESHDLLRALSPSVGHICSSAIDFLCCSWPKLKLNTDEDLPCTLLA